MSGSGDVLTVNQILTAHPLPESLGGEVKIAVAKNLDETSACKFSDGSIIDCGSL